MLPCSKICSSVCRDTAVGIVLSVCHLNYVYLKAPKSNNTGFLCCWKFFFENIAFWVEDIYFKYFKKSYTQIFLWVFLQCMQNPISVAWNQGKIALTLLVCLKFYVSNWMLQNILHTNESTPNRNREFCQSRGGVKRNTFKFVGYPPLNYVISGCRMWEKLGTAWMKVSGR